ncbi:hypothetical protein KBX14_10155 [Corynebacterium sp. CCUG 61414]|uniref:hypothetical protein n=1 Tax=Corynebacterium sp. CCUG 61414 TaxID=2823896 RepID=UPI00210EB57E|nr:hypothetical protein [Corynebacterium sp. CCUG 61414]MCQ4610769.1 hypothetical protein [Corynebacterium sp. CCUG 61414]
MHAFFSWLTSQSGVSLLVALIALGGVLINNRAAEKRRRADQAAADQRRKDDQAAEDARRKADDDRRERERREQLQREDRERQRKAVADCIREITKSAALVSERAAAVHLDGSGSVEQGKLIKAVELTRFNVEATSQLTLLDVEITQPHVSAQLKVLWEQIASDYRPLLEARKRGGQAWINQAQDMPPLSDLALHGIRALTIVARLALLECPEHMATRPVEPLDLEEFYKDTQAKRGDKDNDN